MDAPEYALAVWEVEDRGLRILVRLSVVLGKKDQRTALQLYERFRGGSEASEDALAHPQTLQDRPVRPGPVCSDSVTVQLLMPAIPSN